MPVSCKMTWIRPRISSVSIRMLMLFQNEVSLLSCPSTPQLSRNVPADARFAYGKAVVFGDTIKEAPVHCICMLNENT